MTSEQEEQLDEVCEHLAQAKNLLLELAEGVNGESADYNPDDEPSDTDDIADEIKNIIASFEDLEVNLDELRDAL